jgi:hypothetical protein
MKMRLVVTIVWLVIGLAVTAFAQQKNTVDPQTAQQIRALAMKYDEAFNRNDAAAVAALYTEDGFHAFRKISHRRPAIEKSYAIDFQAWHPSNRVITGDRLKAVGTDRVERTLARKQLLPWQTRAVARRHHEHTA